MTENQTKDDDKIKHHKGELRVIATGSGRKFADLLIPHLKIYQERVGLGSKDPLLVDTDEVEFGDGEVKVRINESVRGTDIYVVADCYNTQHPHPQYPFNINANIAALKSAIAGAKKEAEHVTAVLPAFPYSRQDRRIGREAIMAGQLLRELELAGARKLITFDVHNPAIEAAFVEASMENLKAARNIIRKVKEKVSLENLVICTPDAGGAERAEHYAAQFQLPLVFIHKTRDKTSGEIKKMILVGDVYNKDVLIVDDIAATLGTQENALTLLKEKGANQIYSAVTSAILNRGKRNEYGIPPTKTGKDKLLSLHEKGLLSLFFCADIIDHGDFYDQHPGLIVPVNVKKYAAKVIHNLNIGQGLSKLLDTNYQL